MSILAVIALYNRSAEQSQTLVSLDNAFKLRPDLLGHLRVLVWDNSQTPMTPTLRFPHDYVHSSRNLGTAGAFNRAMEFAEARSISWLLLLDQDTTFTEHFLAKMVNYGDQFAATPEVAAVLPLLWCRGRLISPNRFRSLYRISSVPPSRYGIYKERVLACDSATLMRCAALRAVGGYDEELFWLDFSDIYVFAALHRAGKSIYIASDLQLQHDLAIMDYKNSMSPERYRSFLAAEGVFFSLQRPFSDNVVLGLRLLARGVKQYFRYTNKVFARMTWSAFWDRVSLSKAQRMNGWKNVLARRG